METIRLSNALGAELRGVGITGDLSGSAIAAIRKAWNEHHLIVFRGVALTPAQHIAFSKHFGALDDHASTPHERLDGYPELLEVTNKPKNGQPSQSRNTGRNWHSDYSYTGRPAAASMLYCTASGTPSSRYILSWPQERRRSQCAGDDHRERRQHPRYGNEQPVSRPVKFKERV